MKKAASRPRKRQDPASAFHPEVLKIIRKRLKEHKDLRVPVPSSGDDRKAFAFALFGAKVTSSDISERQPENAGKTAKKPGLDIGSIRGDTAFLSQIPDRTFDLIYTSNGTLSRIDDPDAMNRNLFRVLKPGGNTVLFDAHPFNRPFSGEAFKAPKMIRAENASRPFFGTRSTV